MEAWEFFRDDKGLWRWQCTSADGDVVLISAEAYPFQVQAEIDLEVAREAHLETRKLNYENAYCEYENSIAALSRTQSSGLREKAARALHALERARTEYRETLLLMVFGAEGKDPQR